MNRVKQRKSTHTPPPRTPTEETMNFLENTWKIHRKTVIECVNMKMYA